VKPEPDLSSMTTLYRKFYRKSYTCCWSSQISLASKVAISGVGRTQCVRSRVYIIHVISKTVLRVIFVLRTIYV